MQLAPGAAAPRQTTATTCGSACLVVARSLADPSFAAWLDGAPAPAALAGAPFAGAPLAAVAPADRFARYEALVKARTVAARGLRGPQVPWPGALGTPPWTALAELVAAQGCSPRDYRVDVLRHRPVAERARRLRALGEAVRPGRAALLYVGSATMPRHVCLVAQPDAAGDVIVYEPSRGEVTVLDADAIASGAQGFGGWPLPWVALVPR